MKNSHWPIDDEGHHDIHVCNIFLQVRIWQVQFGTSAEEDIIKVIQIDFFNDCDTLQVRLNKFILVHVVVLGIHMDNTIHHLTPISCVCWHILGILILIRVRL